MHKPLDQTLAAVKQASRLLDYVNTTKVDYETFADVLCDGKHYRLMQTIMRIFVAFASRLAQNQPDPKNEDAIALAKEISEIAKRHPLPEI